MILYMILILIKYHPKYRKQYISIKKRKICLGALKAGGDLLSTVVKQQAQGDRNVEVDS